MGIDRIQKAGQEHWKVTETSESKRDKNREQKQPHDQQSKNRDSFGDSSDFVQLLAKDPRQFKRKKISTSQIQSFTFRGVSTHREKAVLEVDISMADGNLIRGAQIALNRQEGMKLIGKKPGEALVMDSLLQTSELTVALPQGPKRIPNEQDPNLIGIPEKKIDSGLAWFYYLGGGALLLGVILLIYIFLTV